MHTNVRTTLRGKSTTNIKLQVSQIKQLPIYRQGVWNSDVTEYVNSSNNVSIKLNQKAIDTLSKVYDGTPMRVIFKERVNICMKCCEGCVACSSACFTGCVYCLDCFFPCLHLGYCLCGLFLATHVKSSPLNYFRDDYIVAHEIWFGYKNKEATNATCCCCCDTDCGFDNIVTNENKDMYVSLCCQTEWISHFDASVVVPVSSTSVDYTGVVNGISAYDGVPRASMNRSTSQRGNLDYLMELERESLISKASTNNSNGIEFSISPINDDVAVYQRQFYAPAIISSEEQHQGQVEGELNAPLIN